MAAPAEKSLKDLSGKWSMNKDLSDDANEVLKIQGFSALTRSAISKAPVKLSITQSSPDSLSIKQSVTSSVPGISEKWTHDWEARENEDIMGKTKAQSRWIKLDDLEDDKSDLSSGWEGTDDGKYVEAVVQGVSGGWTAHQVWGFQELGGARRFVRRVVVKKESDKQVVNAVYDFEG